MPTFRKASKEIQEAIIKTMADYHGAKADAGVKVLTLMVSPTLDENDDPVGPAITVAGHKAAAKTKILSLKDRVVTGCDAETQIDADVWDESSDEERTALIDHELTHLELRVDDQGGVIRDDVDRPKLRIRKHDRQFGFFDVVAHRHGIASFEVRECRRFLESEDYQQCYLPGMEPVEA
jgi:hypothetical protein